VRLRRKKRRPVPRDRPPPKETRPLVRRRKPTNRKRVREGPKDQSASIVIERRWVPGDVDVSSLSVFPFKIENTKKVGLLKWEPLRWKGSPAHVPGITFKRSTRGWLDSSPLRERAVPFIDHLGRFSPNILGYWRTNDQTYVASLVATVYERLRRLAVHRTPKRKWNRSLGLAFQAACVYVLTASDWFMDRCIALLAKNNTVLRGLVWRVVNRSGADTRFVLGQLLHQSLWLKSLSVKTSAKPDYAQMSRVDPFLRRRPSPRIYSCCEWKTISDRISRIFPHLSCRGIHPLQARGQGEGEVLRPYGVVAAC